MHWNLKAGETTVIKKDGRTPAGPWSAGGTVLWEESKMSNILGKGKHDHEMFLAVRGNLS